MSFQIKGQNRTSKAEAQTDRGGESNLSIKHHLKIGKSRRSLESIPVLTSNNKKSLRNGNPK